MRDVSFDNPYLLLLFIPLILLLAVPGIIAIVKGVKSKSVIASFAIHILIGVFAVLALAGMKTETVITKTEVYVVADVSYSSNRNLDLIDQYIQSVPQMSPSNTSVGVICFGKTPQVITRAGEEIKSVKSATVEDSATDISGALQFASEQFSQDVIKRIVLITDGKETSEGAEGKMVSAIESLYSKGIYIDAVYVDNNLKENDKEIQISDVEYTKSTYLNRETTADVAIRSSYDTKAIVNLYKNGVLESSQAVALTKGFNIANIKLDTSKGGSYDYTVEISTQDIEDISTYNNSFSFSQSVSSDVKVLLVTSKQEDIDKASGLYENAVITACGPVNGKPLPCEIEKLCQYDEYILSNVDLSTLDDYDAFISCLDTAVSKFGKTLITMGNIRLQNTADEALLRLQDMLPVRYGNNDEDPKLYSIVIDISRSMNDNSQLVLAKQAAVQLLSILGDDDYVCVVAFSGDSQVVQPPTKAANREEISKIIHSLQPRQGTFIGSALYRTFEEIKDLDYSDKQVMLITDGISFTNEADNPAKAAKEMRAFGITTSCIGVRINDEDKAYLEKIASRTDGGGGKHYYVIDEASIADVMFNKIADKITVSLVEDTSAVYIEREIDDMLSGVVSLPNVDGYVYSSAKASATVVLKTRYEINAEETKYPPIYAYWDYGEGRACSLTTDFTGSWVKAWESEDSDGEVFLSHMVNVNTPNSKNDFPYTINVEYDGINSKIELIPATLNPNARVVMEIITPSGERILASSEDAFRFDSAKYTFVTATPDIGKYNVSISYIYGTNEPFVANTEFNIPYSPEYDSFNVFSPSVLHAVVRNRGTVNYGEVPRLENNEKEIETYIVRFTIPLLFIAVILYVIDIMVRKLKWNDIKGLFKRKASKQGGAKK